MARMPLERKKTCELVQQLQTLRCGPALACDSVCLMAIRIRGESGVCVESRGEWEWGAVVILTGRCVVSGRPVKSARPPGGGLG